jgi:hypothetical protein
MRWALVALLSLGACIDDRYTCKTDSDCNVGAGGRCELDHLCTQFDPACPLARRYSAHSGPSSNACFADEIVPLDPCASGQPPAPHDTTDACASAVCGALPSCCATGWSDACVQAAEVLCDVKCDTFIAITAEQNLEPTPTTTTDALLDLRITATGNTYVRVDNQQDPAAQRKGFLDWLAPAHGKSAPRIAALDSTRTNLLVSDGATMSTFPVGTDRAYDSLTSVDFDRDGRDKAVFACYGAPDTHTLDVLDLDTGGERLIDLASQLPLTTFGDWDQDGFPDAATATSAGGAGYQLLHGIDTPDTHARGVEVAWSSGATAATMGNAPLQSFAFGDLDGDGILDLIQFGAEVRIHFGDDSRAPNSPRVQIDCDPLALNPPATCVGSDVEVIGTPVFGTPTGRLAVSIDNGRRNIYPVDFTSNKAAALRAALLDQTCGAVSSMCQPFRAIVARDVDGDHVLDLIAIDATLTVYVLHASGTITTINPPAGLPGPFKIVRASVTGVVR